MTSNTSKALCLGEESPTVSYFLSPHHNGFDDAPPATLLSCPHYSLNNLLLPSVLPIMSVPPLPPTVCMLSLTESLLPGRGGRSHRLSSRGFSKVPLYKISRSGCWTPPAARPGPSIWPWYYPRIKMWSVIITIVELHLQCNKCEKIENLLYPYVYLNIHVGWENNENFTVYTFKRM